MITSPDPTTPELHVPVSLGWHREAANWLVGLATAVIVFVLTNIEKIPASAASAWLAGLMLLAFLVTTVCGIFFYFFITEYTHNWLRREKYAALYYTENILQAEKDTYAGKCADSEQKAASSAESYGRYFCIMLPSFTVGVVLAFILAVYTIVIREPSTSSSVYKIQPVAVTSLTPQGIVLVHETTGISWALSADTARQFRWRQLPRPVAAP